MVLIYFIPICYTTNMGYKNKKGFTLLEMSVVIAQIAFFSSLAATFVIDARVKAEFAGAQQFAQQVHRSFGSTEIVHLSFNDTLATDSTINNEAGDCCNITTQSNITWAYPDPDGISGNAYTLDLNIGHIMIKNGTPISDGEPYTVSLWFKPIFDSGFGPEDGIFSTIRDLTNAPIDNGSMQIGVYRPLGACNGQYSIFGRDISGVDFEECLGKYTDGWHHFVVTYNSVDIKVFIDGQSKVELTGYQDMLFGEIRFGAGILGCCWRIHGSFDEVYVYPDSLEIAQIQKLYAEGLQKLMIAKN